MEPAGIEPATSCLQILETSNPDSYGDIPSLEDPYLGLSGAIREHNVEHTTTLVVGVA
jgi:hypothetical protein